MDWQILPAVPVTRMEIFPAGAEWVLKEEKESSFDFCSSGGVLKTACYMAGTLEIQREHFISRDDSWEAFRMTLKNNGKTVETVDELIPFAATFNPDSREYFCEKRLKNEKPFSAVFHGEEIEADNVLLFRSCRKIMLFGWLDQHRHLGTLRVKKEVDPRNYENMFRLEAAGEFYGMTLAPGRAVTTQWCAVFSGSDAASMLSEHARRIMEAAQIDFTPAPAPFVISSWHYFGIRIGQDMLEQELDAIKARRIPAEVYQIDGGWYKDMGDWEANDLFYKGTEAMARTITDAGLTAGIWIAPFMISLKSETASAHPDWFLRDEKGEIITYKVSRLCGVLDLSQEEVIQWIEMVCRRLREAGFRYLKADFTRSFFTALGRGILKDRSKNFLECFRDATAAVRRGFGRDSFINFCGGHAGAVMGLVDSQRTGYDTYGRWQADNPTPAWHRIRQSMFRAWMCLWRHNDPDAATIRLNDTPFDATGYGQLPLGDFTDNEAELMVLNQFIAGGTVALGENIRELDENRLRMMRRVAPAAGITSCVLDLFDTRCPQCFLAKCNGFNVLSRINLDEEPVPFIFRLTEDLLPQKAQKYLVSDVSSCSVIGIFHPGDEVRAADISAHGCRVLWIVPVPDVPRAFIAASDGHYAGIDIPSFSADEKGYRGKIRSAWPYPVKVLIAVPEHDDWQIKELYLEADTAFSS